MVTINTIAIIVSAVAAVASIALQFSSAANKKTFTFIRKRDNKSVTISRNTKPGDAEKLLELIEH